MPNDTFSVLGITVPSPPAWARGVAVVVLVLAAVGGVYYRTVRQPDAINNVLRLKLAETTKHLGETPAATATLLDTIQGKITVQMYRDRCLVPSVYGPDGTLLHSTLIMDMLTDQHAAGGILPVAEAAAPASRCDAVGHGPAVKSGEEARRGCCEVLWHVLLQDGCEFRQWVDAPHGLFGAREWIVCRH